MYCTVIFGGPEEGRWVRVRVPKDQIVHSARHDAASNLLAARVLGDGLCAFADRVFRQFTWQQQTHGGLDLAARDG